MEVRGSGAGKTFQSRCRWFAVLAGLAYLGILLRLWQLQIVSGDEYQAASEDNFIRDVKIPALRGRILDRFGRVLADNRPSYNVYVVPHFFKEGKRAIDLLQGYLNLSSEEVEELTRSLESRKGLERFHPFLLRDDISRDQLALLETHKFEIPGVEVRAVPHRYYPNGIVGNHFVGFMNEVNLVDIRRSPEAGYKVGDYVGRSGVERAYEAVLRGRSGLEKVVVDARGIRKPDEDAAELIPGPRLQEAVPGRNVVLTVDIDLQRIAEFAFRQKMAGAAVVVDAQNGQILAMISKPGYDPNVMTGRLSRKQETLLNQDLLRPRVDKVVRDNFFPGSTFKVVPALAALKHNLIKPKDTIFCGGSYRFGKRVFRCWTAHGTVNLHDALVRSCDTYFWRLAELLGIDRIAEMAMDFGLGKPTGIGINGEVAGRMPTKEWHMRHSPEGYQVGFALNTAIGQGDTKVTPLQLAMLYTALANRGRLYKPQLVLRVESHDQSEVETHPPAQFHRVDVAPEAMELVIRAMEGVVDEARGTAHGERIHWLRVAGKTGTAQVQSFGKVRLKPEDVEYFKRDHAWFTGFAPPDKPKIVVAVLVMHGGHGSTDAAPVAMEIFREYFNLLDRRQGQRAQVTVQ